MEWAKEIIRTFEGEMLRNPGSAVWLRTQTDWKSWEERKQSGYLLALEGLEPLAGRPEALREFHRLGIRMVSLTWNHTNEFAGGAMESGGLTDIGRTAIAIIEELGMALDLSHLNRDSFWQVIEMNPQCPVLVTHANADRLCPHPRNLTDEQIKAVSIHGGTVGVALFPPFLKGDMATIEDVVNHLLHIWKIGGKECLALGCDFDGIGKTPMGIETVLDLPRLYQAIRAGFTDDSVVMGALGKNLCRALRKTGS
jgi:membrane dipeptidase